jgi:hypothetical protein
MAASAVPWLQSRWDSLHAGGHARPAETDVPVPGRRGLRVALALLWLVDAALQFQPYMFGPFFVTQGIEPAAAGNPAVVADSVTWASQVMLGHIVLCNAVFATIQLLIAAGMLARRTLRLALAASVVWALFVWWFGESLGGILIGSSLLTGFPGGVILYALIAVLLWPAGRPGPPARRARHAWRRPASPATAWPFGAGAANVLWLVLWAGLSYSMLLPDTRSADGVSGVFAVTVGQPGWVTAIMNGLSRVSGDFGATIAVGLAVLCAVVAVGVFDARVIRPALVLAMALGVLVFAGQGFGGIFTGQGTDPGTGPLLILLAACYWPYSGAVRSAIPPRDASYPGDT